MVLQLLYRGAIQRARSNYLRINLCLRHILPRSFNQTRNQPSCNTSRNIQVRAEQCKYHSYARYKLFTTACFAHLLNIRVQTTARWQIGGGAEDSGSREHRARNSSRDGPLWRSEGAGPAPAELLVARHGGCSRTHHQVVLVMREGEGWISGVGERAPAAPNPRYGLSMGGRFCGSPCRDA